ncbi:TraB/GumN family protein [Acuticoccus kandeliae]|uniref:TraB/GumN family protein n=1 Tax=Acuticoccus kandeliae TaxID=2073160 RepID=UPI00196ABCF5|nr:TraB/GumN family protein [Acuticoccus kandeliae]
MSDVTNRWRPGLAAGRVGLAAGLVLGALLTPLGSARADCVVTAEDSDILAEPDVQAAIAEADATMVNAKGRLWAVDTDPPSYLIGTFHLAADGIEEPGPQISALVQGAEELFVEVDADDLSEAVAAWAVDPAKLLRPPGDLLSDEMSPAERDAADDVFATYGIPFEAADQMRPFLLMAMLSVPPCAIKSAATEKGLDLNIQALAAEAGVTITALETVDEQLALFEEDPEEMDAIVRMMLAQAEDQVSGWMTSIALYRTGHIGALWTGGVAAMRDVMGVEAAEEIAGTFVETMLAARNRRMVERMLPGLREGGRVVAVGALHMPGDDGLVALLQREGFSVTPIAEGDAPL